MPRPETDHIRRVVSERERIGRGTATVERIMRAGPDALETTPPTQDEPAGVQRITQAPLDRLYRAGTISTREFQAGDRFRTLAHLAAIDPAAAGVDWGATGGGRAGKIPSMFASQRVADARLDLRRAEKAIRGVVWTVLWLGLVKELPLEEMGRSVFARRDAREASVAGAAALQVALGAVADYLGM